MSKYIDDRGERVAESDPKRLVWYSAGCTLWTDDFDVLNTRGIPSCPHCGAVGFQISAEEWEKGIRKFERTYPGYLALLTGLKEKCRPKDIPEVFIRAYQQLRGDGSGE